MKTSSYNSVPVIASIIGSKSRKAMYLTNVTSLDGKRIYKDKWMPTAWNDNVLKQRITVEWDFDSQSLVEFPMSRVTESMQIDAFTDNCSNITTRLVNNKPVEYLQLTERIIVFITKWVINSFEERFTIKEEVDNCDNDDDFQTVIERTAYDSQLQEKFDYIDRDSMYQAEFDTDHLTQWEQDNPEYATYS